MLPWQTPSLIIVIRFCDWTKLIFFLFNVVFVFWLFRLSSCSRGSWIHVGCLPAKTCAYRSDVCTKTLLGGADEISNQWSIDLACSLIDAVFKNSLVWGAVELQGQRALRLATFVYVNRSSAVYSAAAGEAWPPGPWWVTPSPCARRRGESGS